MIKSPLFISNVRMRTKVESYTAIFILSRFSFPQKFCDITEKIIFAAAIHATHIHGWF